MVKINDIEPNKLIEAVVLWTGWNKESMPIRDDSLIIEKFGKENPENLLSIIKALEDDFYKSDARFTAENLQEMAKLSSEHFRKKYPDIADKIINAFSWCYTFDYK